MNWVAKPGFKSRLAALGALGTLMGLFFWPITLIPRLGPCIYAKWLNHPCPGCGMTHALMALRQGLWHEAMVFNPFILVLIASLNVIVLFSFLCAKKPLLLGIDALYLYAIWIFWGLFLR